MSSPQPVEDEDAARKGKKGIFITSAAIAAGIAYVGGYWTQRRSTPELSELEKDVITPLVEIVKVAPMGDILLVLIISIAVLGGIYAAIYYRTKVTEQQCRQAKAEKMLRALTAEPKIQKQPPVQAEAEHGLTPTQLIEHLLRTSPKEFSVEAAVKRDQERMRIKQRREDQTNQYTPRYGRKLLYKMPKLLRMSLDEFQAAMENHGVKKSKQRIQELLAAKHPKLTKREWDTVCDVLQTPRTYPEDGVENYSLRHLENRARRYHALKITKIHWALLPDMENTEARFRALSRTIALLESELWARLDQQEGGEHHGTD